MNKILTAKKFRIKAWNYALENTPNEKSNIWMDKALVEFAKLHCEAQAKAIVNIVHKNGIPRVITDKKLITNAYPLTNIK